MEWLRDQGFDPDQIVEFDSIEFGAPQVTEKEIKAIDICLRLWMKKNGEDGSKLKAEHVREKAEALMKKTGNPIPLLGKQILRDGE